VIRRQLALGAAGLDLHGGVANAEIMVQFFCDRLQHLIARMAARQPSEA